MSSEWDFELFVTGEPRPKQSFKVHTSGNRIFGYSPKSVREWSRTIAQYANIHQKQIFPDVDMKVYLEFHLSNKRRVDCDNLSKLVLDSLQGVIYKDDKRITDLHIVKVTNSEKPGVFIKIKLLGDDNNEAKQRQ